MGSGRSDILSLYEVSFRPLTLCGGSSDPTTTRDMPFKGKGDNIAAISASQSMGVRWPKDNQTSREGRAFVNGILTARSAGRISADNLLQHPWIASQNMIHVLNEGCDLQDLWQWSGSVLLQFYDAFS